MKNAYLWIVTAFVLGGLIGRFAPTEELRAYKKSAEKRETARAEQSANGLNSFIRLANIPESARRPRRPAKPETNLVAAVAREADGDARVKPSVVDDAGELRERPRRFDPEDLRVRIDEAAELWRTRIDLKRTATIGKLGLDEKGAEAFDAALATMNEKLRDTLQTMADELVASGVEMTPELSVRLMGDLAASVAETYDSLGVVVGEDKRGEVSRLQLYEFVDPSVAEPLINVQDRLK